MYKSQSRKNKENLDTRQVFWNKVLEDIEAKLKEARHKVSELEFARNVFARNAKNGAPIPGKSGSGLF